MFRIFTILSLPPLILASFSFGFSHSISLFCLSSLSLYLSFSHTSFLFFLSLSFSQLIYLPYSFHCSVIFYISLYDSLDFPLLSIHVHYSFIMFPIFSPEIPYFAPPLQQLRSRRSGPMPQVRNKRDEVGETLGN